MARLLGKTAGETIARIQAVFKRLVPEMRGSITFDNGSEFAHHALLRGEVLELLENGLGVHRR